MNKLSIEVRMLIAFLLAMVVITVGQYFSPAPPPQPATPAAQTTTPVATPTTTAAAPTASTPASPTASAPGAIQAAQAEEITIETTLHKVTFSNRGATVRSWILKAYKDGNGKPLDLVNTPALYMTNAGAPPPPFTLAFKTPPSADPNKALYQVTRSDDGLGVTFEFSDGRLNSKKTFTFTKDAYLVKVTSQVIENGVLLPHSLVWRGGFGDTSVVNPVADARSLYYDGANSKLEKKQATDADAGPISASGNFVFAGLEDKYFAAVMLPAEGSSLELTTYADKIQNAEKKDIDHVGAAVGGGGALSLQLYVGPKDASTLRDIDKRLEQIIDWGWFFFIAKPLFAALHWLTDHFTHNWGWAIVLLTVLINTVLFPLRLSSMKSSKKMQAIQPQVAKINEKYKGMGMSDPRKGDQQQELMDLYKVHDINPVGGCLPMLLQIPFFYALYKVLSLTIELRGANWLWVADLSQPETMAIRILPLLLMVTQFLSQKMTPSPGMDPTQQKVMMLMPLMFGFMFWPASSGLVLYWLTSNLVSIAQQMLLNRNTPAPAVAVVVPPKKKK